MCKEKQKEPMVIFKVAFSSLIQPSCRPSPLHIHLNSTNLGLETHHPPKSPSLEARPTLQVEGWGPSHRGVGVQGLRHKTHGNGVRGQTVAGSAPRQGTQHSSHGHSHPTLPQVPWGRGHPGFATPPVLDTSFFPWSFSFHFCPIL